MIAQVRAPRRKPVCHQCHAPGEKRGTRRPVRPAAQPWHRARGPGTVTSRMPELPELEALVRAMDEPVSASPVARPPEAHFAVLKTADPPLASLAGQQLEGADATGEVPAVPGRGRYDPGRPPDERRPHRLRRAEREQARQRRADGAVRGRRGARGDRGRAAQERARPPASRGRPGRPARGPRARAARAGVRPRGPRRDAGRPAAAAQQPAARPARRRRHRPRLRRRDPARRAAVALRDLRRASTRTRASASTTPSARCSARPSLACATQGTRLPAKNNARPLQVHGHDGEPCPRCGTTMRFVDFESNRIVYCPPCQTAGRELADRRLSKLLR